jgi:heme exporter protein C
MTASLRLFTFAAPSRFYKLAGTLLPVLWLLTLGLAMAGLYIGFFVAPTDATQGESYRIIFIQIGRAHV